MLLSSRLLGSSLLLAVLALSPPAMGDAAEAKRLFDEGRDALAAGDQDRACTAFEQSLAEEERAGTHFNLARCAIRRGELVAAASHYDLGLELIDLDVEGRDVILRDRDALNARIPRLAVRLDDQSPLDLEVTLDGTPMAPNQLRADVQVDPGEHVVAVDVPGGGREQVTIGLVEGERRQITVGGPRMVVLPAQPTSTTEDDTAMLVGGWTLIGVGIAGVAAGIITGALAVDRHSTVEDLCPDARCTTQEGFDAAQDGKALVIANAVALAVGLASAAVGTTLVILSDGDEVPNGALLRFRVTF